MPGATIRSSSWRPIRGIAPGGLAEIAGAVAALHAAGIGVILDVGLQPHRRERRARRRPCRSAASTTPLYYRHADGDPGRLVNDTGTGNTLAVERPPVDRAWSSTPCATGCGATGIDGFRFDLAAVLGRDGARLHAPTAPLLRGDRARSRSSADLTMIAEPWDVGPGGYQLGSFPPRWLEWNDRYRDDVRRFWRGDPGTIGPLATRLAGSSDIFAHDRAPVDERQFPRRP